MSPILTRPVREQFEHDRIIRLLQARYRRKFEVAINLGPEQNTPVTVGDQSVFPDLVLFSQDRGHKIQGTIEVETGESVNTLEAMSQWALFSRLRAPFMLYVPPSALDTARRLCVEHNIAVSEIWTYHTAMDQVRFTMVQQTAVPTPKTPPQPKAPVAEASPEPPPAAKDATAVVKETTPVAKEAKPAAKPDVKPAKPAAAKAVAAAKTPKPAAKSAPKPSAKPAAPKAAAKKAPAKAATKAAKAAAKPAKAPVARKAAPSSAARKVARPVKRR